MRHVLGVLPAVLAAVALLLSGATWAEPPSRPLDSFEAAKKVAQRAIYTDDQKKTLYCGCNIQWSKKTSGGTVDPAACGYKPRADAARGARIEWEHIVPAEHFGGARACWKQGHPDCVDSKGKAFRGRACCSRVDLDFRRMEADLHNLAPAVGELNGDRSNYPYGEIPGEARVYGACNFEVNLDAPRRARVAEPAATIRGDVARATLYMANTYGVALSAERRAMFLEWHRSDPPDAWERLRDARIKAAQGNSNPYVTREAGR